jgi:hypothetical protein
MGVRFVAVRVAVGIAAIVVMMRVGRRPTGRCEAAGSLIVEPPDDLRKPFASLQIREDKRQPAAHPARIAIHHFERSAYVRRQVDLIDHE